MKKSFRALALALAVMVLFSSVAFAASRRSGTRKIGLLSYLGTDTESFQKSIDDFQKFLKPLAFQQTIIPEMQDTMRTLTSFRDNKCVVSFYDSLTAMLMAIDSEKINEIALPESTARYIMMNDYDFRILFTVRMPSSISCGFRADDKALCDDFNGAINAMKADGTLKALEEKYIINLSGTPEPVEFTNFDNAAKIKVAITGDMPPVDYISEDGKAAGYNTAVLSEIGRRLQKNIELINIEAGARSAALVSGRADVIFWYRSTKGITIPESMGAKEINPLDAAMKDVTEGVLLSTPYYEWERDLILTKD